MRRAKRKPEPALSPQEWGLIFDGVALSAMRNHKQSLAAALVYSNALGQELPDWAREQLAAEQFVTSFSTQKHRRASRRLHQQMESFANDLVRYEAVRLSERPEKSHDKFKAAVALLLKGSVAICDESGMKKSYYSFLRMFGSRKLSNYVSRSVIVSSNR